MLKETFKGLMTNFTNNNVLINEFWIEIETNYSSNGRHYHTLQHLENLFIQLTEIKSDIHNWETILFTLYYHDIVYHSLKSDNEEKSAELAEKRLKQISVSNKTIELCKNQILATKTHVHSTNSDTNYFTDADLAVLGQNWETYSMYYKNIRKEYSIFSDIDYNQGRKKVLNHFLKMERIFKTEYFYKKFEMQAKQNLIKEFNNL